MLAVYIQFGSLHTVIGIGIMAIVATDMQITKSLHNTYLLRTHRVSSFVLINNNIKQYSIQYSNYLSGMNNFSTNYFHFQIT